MGPTGRHDHCRPGSYHRRRFPSKGELISTKRFDILSMKAYGYDQREKNDFYETPEVKMMVVDLVPGESVPQCDQEMQNDRAGG